MSKFALFAALAVLPLVVLCQDDIETICPQRLVQEHRDQLAVFDGICFRFMGTPQSYSAAGSTCRNDNGLRLMPKTKEIEEFILDYMEKNGWDETWLGLTDGGWGTFEWNDGSYLNKDAYNNFGPGQGTRRGNGLVREPCVALHADDKTWHDHVCERKEEGLAKWVKLVAGQIEKSFICQYS